MKYRGRASDASREELNAVNHNDELMRYFASAPEMLPVYRVFEDRVTEQCAPRGPLAIRVQKTQITFSNRYNFACASLPVRRKKGWPNPCLMITFGLEHRLESPRIAVATEPYLNRWTHHVLVARPEDIDDELMSWVCAAYDFSLTK